MLSHSKKKVMALCLRVQFFLANPVAGGLIVAPHLTNRNCYIFVIVNYKHGLLGIEFIGTRAFNTNRYSKLQLIAKMNLRKTGD